jgi:hypothetical protein
MKPNSSILAISRAMVEIAPGGPEADPDRLRL